MTESRDKSSRAQSTSVHVIQTILNPLHQIRAGLGDQRTERDQRYTTRFGLIWGFFLYRLEFRVIGSERAVGYEIFLGT